LRIDNLANYIAKNLSLPYLDEDKQPILVVNSSEVERAASEWGFHDDDMLDIFQAVEEKVLINYKE
jgi:hypothetical protein